MPDTTSGDVYTGRVLEWHTDEGWGVLACDALPDEVWAHFSMIEAEGFRELTAGQSVVFSAERAEQDQYHWRAVRVWTEAGPHRRSDGEDGPAVDDSTAYSSKLDLTYDF